MAGKTKQVSLDAAFKTLLKEFGIPGKKEIDRLSAKIDRLEKMLKKSSSTTAKKALPQATDSKATGARRMSATNAVLDSIKRSKKGVDFARLQTKTGFDEKKLRNIIYRLHKLEKIKRVSRGLYEVVD